MRLLLAGLLATAVLLTACGGGSGSTDSEPADAVEAYLSALADDEGGTLCDLVTARVRAQFVKETNMDCPGAVHFGHAFLGEHAERLKDANVESVSASGDQAIASVELEGHSVKVNLRRESGEWRIDEFGFANSLLGLE
jgi:hypothetical protein